MNEEWITERERFQLLTEIVQASVRGGVIKSQSLSEEEKELIDIGVTDDIFGKDRNLVCPNCDKTYPPDGIPPYCEICDARLEEGGLREKNVQYIEKIWPDQLRDLLEPYVQEFNLSFTKVTSVDEVPISELNTIDGKSTIHISPYFNIGGEDPFLAFPKYNDVFFDWCSLPDLITNSGEIQEDIQDFLIGGEFDLSELEDDGASVKNFYYPGPGSPGPEPRSRLSWYTLLDRVEEKSEANRLSKQRFGINYNEMFERLGMDFLNTVFPHATTVHLGGDYVPDGFVQIQYGGAVKSFLVESKCYSREFKIFEEVDKASRYVQRFNQELEEATGTDCDLRGYIFLADQFDEDRILEDIAQFEDRTEEYGDLTCMCATSKMMKSAVNHLSYLYLREPSATHRIYTDSKRYFTLIKGLSKYTRLGSLDTGQFMEQFVKTLVGIGQVESDIEDQIQQGLEPSDTWEELVDKGKENYPESDNYRPFAD